MPWRMAACRIGSSRSTLKVLPLGWTVTVKGIGNREPRRGGASPRLGPRFCPLAGRALRWPSAPRRLAAAVTDRPTRFKRPVLLIVGCGDIGLRVVRLLAGRWRVLALTSSAARVAELRTAGALPLRGDLDQPASLARLAGLADAVLHLAPPPATGAGDPRTRHLAAALARSPRLRRLVYGSTSGVYGDRAGARTHETAPPRPATERARRRG